MENSSADGSSFVVENSSADGSSSVVESSSVEGSSSADGSSSIVESSSAMNDDLAKKALDEESIIEKEILNSTVLDSSKLLRKHIYDNEKLILTNDGNSISSFIKYSDNQMIQKKFDHRMRLKTELIWTVTDNTTLEKKINYDYDDVSIHPNYCEEIFVQKNLIVKNYYDVFGNIIKKIESQIIKEDESEAEILKEIKTEVFLYDKENRLIEHKLQTENFNSLLRYVYQENFDYPNEKYFENNVLCREKKFESNDVFVESVYFGDAMSIHSRYENNIKVLEKYYVNGIQTRSRSF